MGRGKIEIKKIENSTNRQVTFCKRRGGFFKKATELATLCDAQVGVVVFSASGKLFEQCSPPYSMSQLIERYQRHHNIHFDEIHNKQRIIGEITRMKHEIGRLETNMREYTGEDLSTFTINDLDQLEHQLELSVNKVRERKDQLLQQQLDNLRRKEHILEDQNNYISHVMSEQQQTVPDMNLTEQIQMLNHLGQFYPVDGESSRNLLRLQPQLHNFCLMPMQPNLQHESLASLAIASSSKTPYEDIGEKVEK